MTDGEWFTEDTLKRLMAIFVMAIKKIIVVQYLVAVTHPKLIKVINSR